MDRLRTALLTYRDLLHELVDAPHVQGRLTTSTAEPPVAAAASPAPDEPTATEAPVTEAQVPSDRTNA